MIEPQRDEGRSSLLMTTVKSALVVAGLSCVAAGWLSSVSQDSQLLGRLALGPSRAFDPVTTGSLGGKANDIRLDPCALPRGR